MSNEKIVGYAQLWDRETGELRAEVPVRREGERVVVTVHNDSPEPVVPTGTIAFAAPLCHPSPEWIPSERTVVYDDRSGPDVCDRIYCRERGTTANRCWCWLIERGPNGERAENAQFAAPSYFSFADDEAMRIRESFAPRLDEHGEETWNAFR